MSEGAFFSKKRIIFCFFVTINFIKPVLVFGFYEDVTVMIFNSPAELIALSTPAAKKLCFFQLPLPDE